MSSFYSHPDSLRGTALRIFKPFATAVGRDKLAGIRAVNPLRTG